MTKNTNSTATGLKPAKKYFLWLVTLSLPIVALVILEFALRIFHYGGNTDLVVIKSVGGQEKFSINRSVGRRYFSASDPVIPEPAEDTFTMKKTKRTKRIFCIGESTMAGFPYDFHATAPSMLAARLRHDLPDYDIEVVNLGLSAVSSFVLLNLLEEVLTYEPDLVIVYSGHNEFYGAFGAASSVGSGSNPFLTRVTLSLMQFKTFIAIRDLVVWIGSRLAKEPHSVSGSLMSEMIGDQTVVHGGIVYENARSAYRENITHMIESAGRQNVPILFSALVSNLRDHPPFRSVSTLEDTIQRTHWNQVAALGDSLFMARKFILAADSYGELLALDSGHAMTWFKLARTFDRLGNVESALDAYRKARDHDVLRFRASTDFESDLLRICGDFRIPTARVDLAFEEESANGIPGGKLFTEHLHPNIRGYSIMAASFHSTIRDHGLVVSPRAVLNLASGEESPVDFGVTVFDTLVGAIKTEILTHQWPFLESPGAYRFQPKNEIEAIVHEYVRGRVAWSRARYDLAEYFANTKRFDLARKECLAVSRVIPFSYEPLLRVADYYRQEGLDGEALRAYRKCIEVEDNPYARLKLAILLLEQDMAAAAAEEIEHAFAVSVNPSLSLSPEAVANGRYLLAVAHAKSGKFDKARKIAELALRFNPSDNDVKDLLQQIQRLEQSRPR
ncbi:MAG: tetratricopeptide repeat protein [Bacteroidota bacterium]